MPCDEWKPDRLGFNLQQRVHFLAVGICKIDIALP